MTTASKQTEPVSVQLDAILKSTEEAAHRIMDAADELQKVIAAAPVSKTVKDQVTEITSHIYAACEFQDLTGQRIAKVLQVVQGMEKKVQQLASAFAVDTDLSDLGRNKGTQSDPLAPDCPELPNDAQNQAVIDTLMRKTK